MGTNLAYSASLFAKYLLGSQDERHHFWQLSRARANIRAAVSNYEPLTGSAQTFTSLKQDLSFYLSFIYEISFDIPYRARAGTLGEEETLWLRHL